MSDTAVNWWGAIMLYLIIVGTLKVCNYISVSWWVLLSPFWMAGLVVILFLLIFFPIFLSKGRGDWSE